MKELSEINERLKMYGFSLETESLDFDEAIFTKRMEFLDWRSFLFIIISSKENLILSVEQEDDEGTSFHYSKTLSYDVLFNKSQYEFENEMQFAIYISIENRLK